MALIMRPTRTRNHNLHSIHDRHSFRKELRQNMIKHPSFHVVLDLAYEI